MTGKIIDKGRLTQEIFVNLLTCPRKWFHSTCTVIQQDGTDIAIHIHKAAKLRFWHPALVLGVVNLATDAAYIVTFEQFKAIMELPISVPEELRPYKPTWLDIMAIIRPIGETNG